MTLELKIAQAKNRSALINNYPPLVQPNSQLTCCYNSVYLAIINTLIQFIILHGNY